MTKFIKDIAHIIPFNTSFFGN